ncbi:hypothetical protein ASPVEDRAFT_893748 [Aspergillus versicolor CBS 583.65]|uniref:NmrA-like domain-containing protein n=1 Tax=Aspergillus versicolor CBS 583.65 TaxID=1036611 RepID=A0A1L9PUX7_ASPVE|nr:uncharacterized protein ASPVEDRAFT_893748 [Aspergillus versicolor CBS 583.65]OJJ05321.1 hypothetical protein ASPVEDRAFT_893748 [Aspergillus versicolor CBS 583.65]
MVDLREIAVIGGTGAQGMPVVKALAESGRYRLRVLTRNPSSTRAQQLAALPNVTLLQGAQDNQRDLHSVFRGSYGAWVNTDGFTLGEKDELFYGFRAYEIARSEGVQHYVWANIEYAMDSANFDEKYHCGHMESKGRVGKFILAEGQDSMKSTLFSTGPYMDMLMDGLFVPIEQQDGSFLWANPAPSDVKIPLIALCDIGAYNLWIFDNPSKSAGMDLQVMTDNVSFGEIATIFTEVTGKPAVHKPIPFETYASVAEPYPGASVNWVLGPDAARDDSVMSWRENFGAWWRYWGDGITKPRDTTVLDHIHPQRIKTLADWMKHVSYDGKQRSVLKMVEDWSIKSGESPQK